jgi:hypothetical protein
VQIISPTAEQSSPKIGIKMQGLKVDLIIKHIIQTEIHTFFCHVDQTTSPKARTACMVETTVKWASNPAWLEKILQIFSLTDSRSTSINTITY